MNGKVYAQRYADLFKYNIFFLVKAIDMVITSGICIIGVYVCMYSFKVIDNVLYLISNANFYKMNKQKLIQWLLLWGKSHV